MVKTLFGFFILIFVLTIGVSTSLAHEGHPQSEHPHTSPGSKAMRPQTASKAADLRQMVNSGTLKGRATGEIDRQIKILQELLTKVPTLTHLTTEEQSTISTQIQTEITNLQTIKSQTSATANETTLKTNIRSILASHKNFSFYAQQVRLLIAAEAMDAMANRMLEAGKKIEARIAGADSEYAAQVTPLLENMNAKLNNAKAQSNSITAAISAVTPTSNRTVLQSAHTKLKTGMADIRSALKDLKDILKILQDKDSKDIATPSAEM